MNSSKIILSLVSAALVIHANGQSWVPIGGGVNDHVRALYVDTLTDELYFGGSFKYANGQTMNGMAKWDGTVFSPLGTGSDNCNLFNCPGFLSIMRYKDEIYCSSLGFDVGGAPSKGIVRWDGVEWDSVGGGTLLPDGDQGIVWAQMVDEDTLYIMGIFYLGGNVYSPGIVKWDGQQYLSMGFPYAEPLSDDPWILDAVRFEGELYVGGQFAGGLAIADQIDVAKFDGHNWLPVGGGIKGAAGDVNDLIVYKGELYACGGFKKSSGNAGSGIVKLRDGEWVDVGGSFDEETTLAYQMLEYHGDLYVFGRFEHVGGGVPAKNAAKWDGEKWCGLGNTFDGIIECAAVYHDSIFIGGAFMHIDGDSLPFFAKWYGDYTDTCGAAVSSSTETTLENTINIWPNPTSHLVEVHLPAGLDISAEIRLFAATGQQVLTQQVVAGRNSVVLEGLVPGIYFYEVRDACLPGQEGRILQTGKLVKVE